MKRVILAGLVLTLMAFLLAACGEDKIVTVKEEVIKEVQVEVERIVEKEVPVEIVREVEVVVEKEVPVVVEKIVEREVEVVREVEVEVEKIERVVVEVPGETVVVEKIVEKEVEVVIEVVTIPDEVAVVATAVAGQSAALTAEGAKYGGTLRVVAEGGVVSLDPSFSSFYTSTAINSHIFEHLFAWDLKFRAVPQMIGDWSVSSDLKDYSFTLRDGLSFHDGTSVGSDDVIASLGRWWDKSAQGKIMVEFMGADGGITAADANNFTMKFEKPFAYVLTMWALPSAYAAMYPKRIGDMAPFEDVGEENIIGSGPYRLAEWDPGNFVLLERNDAYIPRGDQPSNFGGAQIPYLDQIRFLEISAEETKIAGLRTGEWDVVDGAGLDFFTSLSEDPDIGVATYSGHQSELLFHTNLGPTALKLVRQAVLASLDVEALMAALGPSDLWFLCSSKYFCGTPLETNAGDPYYNQNDPAKAMSLLTEAGYTGETIIIHNPTDYNVITPLGLVLGPMLERGGMTVDMPAIDWAGVIASITADSWNIIPAWNAQWSIGDPISDIIIGGGVNWGTWVVPNDRFPAAQREYIEATDPKVQKVLLDEIMVLYMTELPTTWLGQWSKLFPHSIKVKNFQVPAIPNYSNVWVDR